MFDQQPEIEASTAAAVPQRSDSAAAHQDINEHEPRLTYDLFGGDVAAILSRDSATCLCVSSKLLALGTQSGAVYLLDYEGNKVKNYQEHSAAVTDLSFDADAETLASSSLDGYVTTYNVYTNEVQRLKCQQDSNTYVTTVTLDPRHSHRKTKEFVYGTDTGMLLLSSKGWLGNTETILFQGRGRVHTARMAGTLLAWATESGLRVYNTADHSRIGKIDRPVSLPKSGATSRTSSTNYRDSANSTNCSLTWVGDRELLVGWGNHVMVLAIVASNTSSISNGTSNAVPQSPTTSSTSNSDTIPMTPRHQMPRPVAPSTAGTPPSSSRQFALQVVSNFEIGQETDIPSVVGVAPFGRHLALLLNSNSNSNSATAFKVFDRSGNELFTEPIGTTNTLDEGSTTSAAAPLLGFTSFYSLHDVLKETTTATTPPTNAPVFLRPSTTTAKASIAFSTVYKWWSDGAEPVYFIISPKFITLGRPRSGTDRISWLVQRNRYCEAVRIADSDPSVEPDARVQLGEQYLHYLIGTEETQRAMSTAMPGTSIDGAASGDDGRNSQQNDDEHGAIATNNAHSTRNYATRIKNQAFSIKNYKKAADLCPWLLGKDSAAWERWVYIFGQAAHRY